MSLLALVVVVTALNAGCGPAPGSDPRVPSGAVRVVPASLVVAVDGCDDAEDCAPEVPPPPSPIEYVKLNDWQPSAQVVDVESSVPPRGDEPPTFTKYPSLTLHRPIGDTSVRRLGRRTR